MVNSFILTMPLIQPVELPSCYKASRYFDIRYTSKDWIYLKGISNLTTIRAAKNTSRIRSLGSNQTLLHHRLESFMRWRNHAGGDPWPPRCCGRPPPPTDVGLDEYLHHQKIMYATIRGSDVDICVSFSWFVCCSFDPATVGFLHRHGLRVHCAGLWILIMVGARIPVACIGKDMLQGW